MKIHRFIISTPLTAGEINIADKELIAQIRQVLRLTKGDEIILVDGSGAEALATISNITNNALTVIIPEITENTKEPLNSTTLYCSILKRENFELICQKATEIGVKKIVPVLCLRTIKLNLNHQRLEKIIKEAGEQSGRGILPSITEPLYFEDALKQASANDINILYDPSGNSINPSSTINTIGIFVGPEGGWHPDELKLAKESNIVIGSLGSLTLRGETAAIIASYLAVHYND